MKNIDEIKKDLERGDYPMIARISKIPLGTVKSIMSGARNHETTQGARIIEAAEKLIESRKQLLAAC